MSSGSPRISLKVNATLAAPLEATFTATLPGGGSVDWQFEGGSRASGPSVTHIFYQPGRYQVQATMTVAGREYLASIPVEVRSSGPEQAAAVLLQDAGSLALSAQGSVVYAPYTPRFSLDGRATSGQRQPIRAGTHTVQVDIDAQSGAVSRSYTFKSRDPLSDQEVLRQRGFEAEVLRLTNQARSGGWDCKRKAYGGPGLPSLRLDTQLNIAARAQSVGMALGGYFDHRSATDGSLPDARIRASGYNAVSDGENIAAGQKSPAEVVLAWLNSATHCPNIMGDYQDIGVAYISQPGDKYSDYWTQVFGKK